jgi:fructokinase
VGSTASGLLRIPAHDVEVVDTVGAGDSYTSALLAGLAGDGLIGAGRRGSLRQITADALSAIADNASRAAAITCSRSGANPPTRAELDTFVPSLAC